MTEITCADTVTFGGVLTGIQPVNGFAVMRLRRVKAWAANRGRYRRARQIGPLARVPYIEGHK